MDTILIIEEEAQEIDFLEKILSGDFRLEIATGRAEAKAIVEAKGHKIKAVLLDWILEGRDGVELMGWLKAHPEVGDVEVVVQSSEFNLEYIRAGLDSGAYYYLTKPFEPTLVCAIVHAAIETCERSRSLERRIEKSEDAVRLMTSGTYRFRTREQAEALAVHLASQGDDSQPAVALLELLVNAVEHGNLEITYQEKGQLIAEGAFEAEIERRLDLPQYRDRRVQVEVERRNRQFEVTITDEGKGFDFRRYLKMDKERLFDAHGRGVFLASSTLAVEYFEPGNKVRVTVPIAAPR